MILYNQHYEMIGISSEGLSLFGFLTPEDFFRSCNDVSEYFLETSPLYNAKKHYIDLIISESQSNIQDMQIKLDNGDIISVKIAVEVVNLKGRNEHYYSVKLLYDGNRLSTAPVVGQEYELVISENTNGNVRWFIDGALVQNGTTLFNNPLCISNVEGNSRFVGSYSLIEIYNGCCNDYTELTNMINN